MDPPDVVIVSVMSYLPFGPSFTLKGILSLNQEIVRGRSPSASHLRLASCPFLTVSARNLDLKCAATVVERVKREKAWPNRETRFITMTVVYFDGFSVISLGRKEKKGK